MLTPAKTDPNYANEKVRRAKEPDTFGAGDEKTQAAAKAKADREAKQNGGK